MDVFRASVLAIVIGALAGYVAGWSMVPGYGPGSVLLASSTSSAVIAVGFFIWITMRPNTPQ